MINLLTPENSKRLKTIYRLRLATAFFLLAAIIVTVAVVLTVPSYVVLRGQTSAYQETSSAIENEQADVSNLVTTIKDANLLAKEIADRQNEFSFNEIVSALRVIGGDTVKIDTVSYESGVQPKQFLVSGIAANRAALTGFGQAVEEDTRFASADIPIQNLAGDRDVAFTVTVVMATAATE